MEIDTLVTINDEFLKIFLHRNYDKIVVSKKKIIKSFYLECTLNIRICFFDLQSCNTQSTKRRSN